MAHFTTAKLLVPKIGTLVILGADGCTGLNLRQICGSKLPIREKPL